MYTGLHECTAFMQIKHYSVSVSASLYIVLNASIDRANISIGLLSNNKSLGYAYTLIPL